jgi:hypothetical protein
LTTEHPDGNKVPCIGVQEMLLWIRIRRGVWCDRRCRVRVALHHCQMRRLQHDTARWRS